MIGVKRLHSDRTMFFYNSKGILKADGNYHQRAVETNDWVNGKVGDTTIANWAKFQGGDEDNIADYDVDAQIDMNNFPDV